MQRTAFIVWIYGALVLTGGLIGWVNARSKPSLISGLAFGAALLALGSWIQFNPVSLLAQMSAIGLAGILLVVMTIRLAKTRKFVPAGVMVVVSVLTLILLLMYFCVE